MKRLITVFVFFVATTVNVLAAVPSLVKDITCPPTPTFTKGACEAKCPSGYVLSPGAENANWRATGLYACVPKDVAKSDFKDLKYCYYYNPNCAPSTVGGAVESFVKKRIDYYLPKAPEETYIDQILQIATLDPRFAAKTEKSAPTDFFMFIYDSFKILNKNSSVLATLYFSFLSIWLLAVAGFSFYTKERNVVISHIPRWIFGLGFFVVPIVVVKTPTGKVYQPAIVWAIRKSVYLGNKKADELAIKLNTAAVNHILTYSYWKLSSYGESMANTLTAKLDFVKENEKKLKWCKALWGGNNVDFLVPDDVLEKYTFTNDTDVIDEIKAAGENPDSYSRVRCRGIEKFYKMMVADYNKNVVALTSVENVKRAMDSIAKSGIVEEILSHPESVSEEDIERSTDKDEAKLLKQIKVIAVYEKKLGWISYPLITLPILKSNESLFTLTSIINIQEPNIFIKAFGYLIFPPGSMILSAIMKIGQNLLKLFTLGSFLAKIAAAAGGTTISVIVAYKLTDFLLNIIPIVFLVVAVSIRFIFYFAEILKMTVISPFVGAFFSTVRRYDLGYRFVAKVFFLAAYPLIFLIAAFVSYATISLTSFLIYDMPVRVFNALHQSGVINNFELWIFEALMFWLKTVVAAYLAFKIVMRAPETIIAMLGINEVAGQMQEHGRELIETAIRKTQMQV